MTTLTCPKCRQGLPDVALDAGQCPLCGFPFDGPVVLGAAPARAGGTWFRVAAVVLVLVAAGVGAVLAGRANPTAHETASTDPPPAQHAPPTGPALHVASVPPEVTRPAPADPVPTPPVSVEPPKRDGPRPVGVVMKVDPRIAPDRHFDHPDDTAALPDLNSGDKVKLTGRVRVLRLGSVHGKAVLDASGLVAEEVVITGDLDGEAVVLLNAPNGTVTVGGYVVGAAKLTVRAPGGVVVVANTGRVTGGASVTVAAKRLDVNCPICGGARVLVTLNAGGALKIARAEEGTVVTYKKAAATDPAPSIVTGEMLGGARVVEGN